MEDQSDTSFLQIDQNRLDREWVRQPKLYHHHAVELANAKLALDEAESALDLVRADTTLDIYERPSAYDIEKATKDTVEAALLKNKSVKAAQAKVREAKHAVEVLTAVVKALDHKKRALESLVSLHGQDYFATPKAPTGAAGEQMEQASKKAVRSLGRRQPAEEEDDDV